MYGDPDADVSKVLFAVDPAPEVAREAAEWGADLLVVHHPLFLKPVHGFPATTPKGRTLATLAGAGCALLTAHTNADRAVGGVSEAMAHALGLTDVRPLLASDDEAHDKLVVFVPVADADAVRAALADAGAGRIGDYDHASFSSPGQGRFRPLEGANPAIGVGRPGRGGRRRNGSRCSSRGRGGAACWPRCWRHIRTRSRRTTWSSWPTRARRRPVPAGSATWPRRRWPPSRRPSPRRCRRPPTASGSPATRTGPYAAWRCAAERATSCSARVLGSGADVYVTSDLRHHPAAEFLEQDGPALVDVAHWAAEWTWLPVVRARVAEALGDTVETRVSTLRTDPWQFRL